jgi:subfamily B ATP-binding cassette protein MsbA
VSENTDPQLREVYRRLWSYVSPHRLIGLIAIVAMAGTAIVEVTMVWLVEPLIDEALVARQLETARWMPFAFAAIFFLRGLTGFATEASLGWIGRSVISSLRLEVFGKFLTLPTKFFEKHSTAPLMSRMIYNVEMVAESVTSVVVIAVRDFLTVIAAISLMIYQSPKLFVFVVILLPIVATLVQVLGKAFRRYSRRIQDSVGEVAQVSDEVLNANRIVKIFGGHEYEYDRLSGIDQKNRQQHVKLIYFKSFGTALTQVVFGIGVAFVIYVASGMSIDGLLSAGQFMSFFGAMMLLLQPLRRIMNVNATLQRGLAAGQSLFAVIDEPDEVNSGTTVKDRVSGKIEFRDVSFAYDDDQLQVLDGVSCTVEAGNTLAIVGHSGSGKSTLVSLLPRFYDLEHGTILLDDIPVQDYDLLNLRSNISLVTQEVVLFNDTIANNLAYGQLRQRPRSELLQAAEAAHIMDFVKDMPNGLDTVVGDRGVLLSGGQRQRIAIGRALLKDAPILILDEATSSLDTQSERRIQAALDALMKNRTTLVIAHRLSTVEKADQIIVLDKGRITESGTHKTLLEQGGIYANLYRLQFADD